MGYKYAYTQAKWIETLPDYWECKKIGSLFIQRNEKVSDKEYAALSVSKGGIVPQLESAVKTDAGDNRKLVLKGDFVINSRSDRKGSCGVSLLNGSVSLINIVLRPRQEWNEKYVHYLLRSHLFSEEFYRNGRGIVADLWTTRYSEMKSIMIPVPPREEQDQIVRYLDWQTSKINKLIAAKKKQIEVLKEKKKVFITDIVIKGTNPFVQFKETEIKLLGCIPKHWKIVRNKYLFREINDTGYTNLPLLSITNSSGVVLQSETGRKNRMSENVNMYKRIQLGDIGYNLMNAFIGSLGVAQQEGLISPAYAVCRPIVPMCPKYFEYLYKTPIYLQIFDNHSYGIMIERNRLYFENFSKISSVVPPIEEQEYIVEVIQQYETTIHKLISKLECSIQYLQELHTRLISDVVTGQIDVQGIEVPDFELVEETIDIQVEDEMGIE